MDDDPYPNILKMVLDNLAMFVDSAQRLSLDELWAQDYPNDLVYSFYDWTPFLVERYGSRLTIRQTSLLVAIDAYLTALDIERNPAISTPETLREGPEWADLRILAGLALDAFGVDRASDP